MTRGSPLGALALAAALALGASGALAAEGEFGNECVTSLAFGKTYQTDCTINTVYQGKTYCFGGEKSREVFLKNPDKVLTEAKAFYSSKQKP